MKKSGGWGEVALLLCGIAFWQVYNIYDKLTNSECKDNWFKVLAPTWCSVLFIAMLFFLLKLIWFGSQKGGKNSNEQDPT